MISPEIHSPSCPAAPVFPAKRLKTFRQTFVPAAVTKQESEGWEFAKEVGKTLVIGVAAGAAVYLGTLAAYKLSVACGWLPEENNGSTDDGAQA